MSHYFIEVFTEKKHVYLKYPTRLRQRHGNGKKGANLTTHKE